jgi:hypothetical protein
MTCPGHRPFTLIQPSGSGPCSRHAARYAASERTSPTPGARPVGSVSVGRDAEPVRRQPRLEAASPLNYLLAPFARQTVPAPGDANAPLAPGGDSRLAGPTVRSDRSRRDRITRSGIDPVDTDAKESLATRRYTRRTLGTRELQVRRYARTSARLRTPQRCSREYGRAH